MKISDQGFTEVVASQPGRTSSIGTAGSGQTGSTTQSGLSDRLQLSSLAAQLQQASGSDSARTARLSQIAAAVQNGTFQFNAARVSTAMISEAIGSGR